MASENGIANSQNSDWSEILKLKDSGNENFKNGNYDEALNSYTKALKLHRKFRSSPTTDLSKNVENGNGDSTIENSKELLTNLYKNRAAVYLKKEDFTAAERDATKALEFVPNDSKALFRRAQAREQLGDFSKAFEDAKFALQFEKNNKAILQLVQRLAEVVQKKQVEAQTTGNRVNQMFQYCFDAGLDPEKRLQAMNNLLVLARENAGAELILEKDGVEKLMNVIMQEKNADEEIILAAERVVDELARDENRALKLIKKLKIENIVALLTRSSVQRHVDAAALLIQRCFNALAAMNPKEFKKPDEELVEKNKEILTTLIFALKSALINPQVSAMARNLSIDLILKNLMHMDNGLPRGWSWKFYPEPQEDEGLRDCGLWRLLQVACNIPEHSKVPVTHETRDHLAICLARLYEDCVFDRRREAYSRVVKEFVEHLRQNDTPEMRVELCALMTTLLLGPFEIGFNLITAAGMTEMLLKMADSDDALYQSVALEAIVQTASKKERCIFLANQGLPVLKKLYHSKDAGVQARALVGLCKVAASSGTDASMKPVAEGSELKLAMACKKMLLNGNLPIDVRRWAAEGLSYITLDADVKEWAVEDTTLIRALVELAKKAGQLCIFGVASVFVNLTNMYEKPNIDPELKRVAQFSKHHVPEDHPKDADEFVQRRVSVLIQEGAVSACVAISNTESMQCKEMLARALFSFTKEKEHRGIVVQEGGAKLLVKLALQNTEAGKTLAAQGLARIGVTINPEIAFPGQRMYEIVKSLVGLLHYERSGLQNYEALLTLTNLASMSDSVRLRIFKEKALPMVEEYWLMQEHKDLRAAATELYMNLLHTKEVRDYVLQPSTDRLKVWLLYAGEEDDDRLAMSATAGLAILTENPEACKRLINEVKSWEDIFRDLCTHANPTIQYRGMIALANMMESDYDVAAKIVQTNIIEYLTAIEKMNDPTREKAKTEVKRALAAAEKWELIKPTDRELYERSNRMSTVKEE